MKKILVTGSAGLVGSESVKFYCKKECAIFGIDNDMRGYFFGKDASTSVNKEYLKKSFKNYIHKDIDIRDKNKIENLFKENKFDLIIHTAAQPSHDWAAREPFTDFEINANGTLNLLENFRKYCPEAVFIFTSTNKVYGDVPNKFKYVEKETRYELDRSSPYATKGFDESLSIDQSKHSLLGASKVAADILVQEYGRYFDLKTGIFRPGCLTGPAHAGAELHGFLAYLVKCINTEKEYTILGYKGKQVRDNLHSFDLITVFDNFFNNPKIGEVYNIGGSVKSNISIIEAVTKIEACLNKKAKIKYLEKNREGDHIWYISDISKFKNHFPLWNQIHDIDNIIQELCEKKNKDFF